MFKFIYVLLIGTSAQVLPFDPSIGNDIVNAATMMTLTPCQQAGQDYLNCFSSAASEYLQQNPNTPYQGTNSSFSTICGSCQVNATNIYEQCEYIPLTTLLSEIHQGLNYSDGHSMEVLGDYYANLICAEVESTYCYSNLNDLSQMQTESSGMLPFQCGNKCQKFYFDNLLHNEETIANINATYLNSIGWNNATYDACYPTLTSTLDIQNGGGQTSSTLESIATQSSGGIKLARNFIIAFGVALVILF